ncbi:uncharacterized protein [Miscanthus floridulus]|uniref:uncharacterized protein n=1 Tax=Miscanthus floridulus TaxID=154761 RepID=UPI00345A9367
MAAYCQEVRWLEDKFDGLELNHVLRCLNEAADALAKVVFGREPVPTSIFASDQHKPLVRYEESDRAKDGLSNLAPRVDPPTVSSNPEVMELKEDPTTEPDSPDDWRMPYLEYLLHNTLPTDRTEARRLARRAKSFVLVEGKLYRQSHQCVPEGVTLLEFEGANQEEEPKVQEADEAVAAEELPKCPDHQPSSFLKASAVSLLARTYRGSISAAKN